jgi:CheY-like chemotaxis protein
VEPLQVAGLERAEPDFLAMLSHEVRTPLTGVLGSIELLLDTGLSPEQHELATVARDSARTLMTIVDDVLDLSRSDAEDPAPRSLDLELADVVEGVADLLEPAARRKGLCLTAYVDPRASGTLRGDPGRLRQVLLNLAANAVKFTGAGEVAIRADLCEPPAAGTVTVRFAVADSGPGIPEDSRDRLFEPFARLGGDRSAGGTGLGLTICRRLVRLMGGELRLEDGRAAGAEFAFTLAFSRVAGVAAPPRSGLRVLVVEEGDAPARVVAEYLAAWGMTAARAVGGRAAARLAHEAARAGRPFDVAIVGAPPGGDATAVAHALRSDPAGRRLGLVLLRDLGDGTQRGPAHALFAAELGRPVRRARLFETVTQAADPRAPRAAQASSR